MYFLSTSHLPLNVQSCLCTAEGIELYGAECDAMFWPWWWCRECDEVFWRVGSEGRPRCPQCGEASFLSPAHKNR
jgi:hypothetical protein